MQSSGETLSGGKHSMLYGGEIGPEGLSGGQLSGGSLTDGGALSGGELEGGKKHKRHTHHNGRSGLNKAEKEKVAKAHMKKGGSPVVKLTEAGVLEIRNAIRDYQQSEYDAAQAEVSSASTKEEKAGKLAKKDGFMKTAKLASKAVEKMDAAES